MSYPNAVIFDFDGTLIDSAPDLRRALNATLAGEGLEPLSLPQVKRIISDGVSLLVERAFEMAKRPLKHEDAAATVLAFERNYAAVLADPACLLDGCTEVLTHLQAAGVKLGLCTNKAEGATLRVLKQLGLRDFFGAVAGGDSFPYRKPDGRHPAGVAARLGVDAASCVMVGDSMNDVIAGRGALMRVVWMDSGYGASTPAGMAMPEVDGRINSLRELPSLLQGLR